MNAERLRAAFGLPAPMEIVPLRPGTEARVWRADCPAGAFLLRTLSGPEQGAREWTIVQHLIARGFAALPAILTAPDGRPMAELDGAWYQLQTFCHGAMPDPGAPGAARRMARAVCSMEDALADCPPEDFQTARPLDELWAAARPGWAGLGLSLSADEADRAVARLAAAEEAGRVIHGDLGPWNMVDDGETVRVIDFGAARLGDPYFDLAAALGGIVNHAEDEERGESVKEFLDACRVLLPGFDGRRLKEQFFLWTWRGLAACALPGGLGPAMARRFYHALQWGEETFREL